MQYSDGSIFMGASSLPAWCRKAQRGDYAEGEKLKEYRAWQ